MWRLSPVILLCVAIQGCYVPPVWDLSDAINYVDSIEEGVTTKQEVLKILGKPDREDKYQDNVFYYSGSTSAGEGVIGGFGGRSYGGLLNEKYWWITVTFDKDDVVVCLMSSASKKGC